MDIALVVIGLILMILGILGSFLPVLPGLPLCWIALLLVHLTSVIKINYWLLGISLLITIGIELLSFLIPSQGTKKFGGTKYGIWGTNIGLVIGILTPVPLGFLIGPFIGAIIGELYFDLHNRRRALRAAMGSVIGLMASTFINLLFCLVYFIYYLKLVWEYQNLLF